MSVFNFFLDRIFALVIVKIKPKDLFERDYDCILVSIDICRMRDMVVYNQNS